MVHSIVQCESNDPKEVREFGERIICEVSKSNTNKSECKEFFYTQNIILSQDDLMLSVDLVSTPRLYKHMILKDYLIHLTAFLESKKPFIFVQDTIKYRSDKSNMSSMQMMNYPNFKLAFENYSTLGYMASFLIIEHDLIDPTPIVMDQLICLIPLKELAFIQEYQGEVKDIVFCQQNIIKALEIMVLRAQLVSEINKEEYKYTTPLLERFVEKYASDYLDYSSSADDYITGYGFMILK